MKRVLLVSGIGAVVLIVISLIWATMLFGPVEDGSFGKSHDFLTESPKSELHRSSPGPQTSGIPEAEPDAQTGQMSDDSLQPNTVANSVARIRKHLRIMEQRNTTMLGVIDGSESLGSVAVVSSPTDEQTREVTAAITSELAKFGPGTPEYNALEAKLNRLIADYVRFETPKKVIAAFSSRQTGDKRFVEFTGIDETAVKFTDDGKIEITAPSSTGSRLPQRYEYLFTQALRELERTP